MKILMILAVLLTLSTTNSAFAGDRNSAYNVICKPMSFESDRNKCVQVIKPFSYFDDGALSICTIFAFDSTKMECLGYIGNKNYEAYEVDACRNATFDSEKLRCLRENGQISGGQSCIPSREVLNQLRAAQNELRQGQTGIVDKRLTYLIAQFSGNCQ